MGLRFEMQNLVNAIVTHISIETECDDGIDHHFICSMMADDFELWDENDQFPIWLSRVVEGEIMDFIHNEYHSKEVQG